LPAASPEPVPYAAQRPPRSEFLDVRGLRYHVRRWGDPQAPALFMVHGWMDVSASFQFLVDCLRGDRQVLAPDWRGYGLTARPGADCYWFPDYVADLDRLLDRLVPNAPVDLVGHSMGGTVATLYAGVRPQRIRRLVNMEGFGLRRSAPEDAPQRYRDWLDGLAAGKRMRDYGSRQEVADRLMRNNPRLAPERALYLAQHWAAPGSPGRFEVLGDPAHKVANPILYRVEEVLAVWRQICAPVLLVTSGDTARSHRFIHTDEYRERLLAIRNLSRTEVADAGHMLHHDQPRQVAALIETFIDG